MYDVLGVLDYAGFFSEAAGTVDRTNGWEVCLCDGLGCVHHLLQLLAVLDSAGARPSCNTTRKDAFYFASVKVGESRSGHAKLP